MLQIAGWLTEPELLRNLTLREVRSKYKRTALGWAWSLLNPIVTALIYTLVFSSFFHARPPTGNPSGLKNFTLFLLAGLLPWNMLAAGLSGSMMNLLNNATLITKVKFRRETIIVATVISCLVTLAIEMSVLTAAIWLFSGRIPLAYVPIVALIAVFQFFFVLGVGLLFSAANVFLRDLQYLSNLGLMAWMYLTPVVYPLTFVPLHARFLGRTFPMRQLIRINPMTAFVQAYKSCLYDLRPPTAMMWASMVVTSIVSYLVGILAFNRLQGRFAEEI